MKRIKNERGFRVCVFSPGDGMLQRWSEHLQKWRAAAPARRKLAHATAWYLDAEARSRRPLYGMHALAIFTERVLWEALTKCDPEGREVASARRAFLAVRKKMSQMKYRESSHRAERRYLRSCVARCAALAKKAYLLVKGGEPDEINHGRGRPRKDAENE